MYDKYQSKLFSGPPKTSYLSIGLMSGTSMDGIDAALLATDGMGDLSFKGGKVFEYPAKLQQKLSDIIQGANIRELKLLEREITLHHAQAVNTLLSEYNLSPQDIDLIGFHGHTVLHEPEHFITHQIGDGSLLAQLTKIDVINNFRVLDVSMGGHGAPLVPIFHKAIAASYNHQFPIAFLNIGGIANVTYIDSDNILAFDTGPGNCLSDDLMKERYKLSYDKDGICAAQGRVDEATVASCLKNPFFEQSPPKSLDRGHFSINKFNHLTPNDALATALRFTAYSISVAIDQLPQMPNCIYVCGGGRRNRALMKELAVRYPIRDIDAPELDGDLIEAYAFAYLAVRSKLGLSVTFPGTTATPQELIGGVFCPFWAS